MKIPILRKFQKPRGREPFADLPFELRVIATMWLERFIERRLNEYGFVAPWLYGIYCGQAKRLALNPPTPEWGRRLRAIRGGKAVQRKYKQEGRHPTAKATAARKLIREARGRGEPIIPTASTVPVTTAPRAPFRSYRTPRPAAPLAPPPQAAPPPMLHTRREPPATGLVDRSREASDVLYGGQGRLSAAFAQMEPVGRKEALARLRRQP